MEASMNEMRQVCNNARGGTERERERETDRQTDRQRQKERPGNV